MKTPCSSCVILFLFISAFSLPGATLAAAPSGVAGQTVELILWDGSRVRGDVADWSEDRVVLATPEGPATVEKATIKSYVFDKRADASRPARSADPSSARMEAPDDLNSRIQTARVARNTFVTIGVAGVIAGTAVFLDGSKTNRSAGDVPGCSVSGSTAFCVDQASTDEAQSRIDDGENKMIQGALIALVGAAALGGGMIFHNRMNTLERRRNRRGFSLNYDFQHRNAVQLAYQVHF